MSNKINSGVAFSDLLTIAFIMLKLMGYITWSWLWILSPMWIVFIIALLVR